MPNKQDYTRQFLSQLPETERVTPEQAMVAWWQDIRVSGGLRLSYEGYQLLEKLKIEHFDFELPRGANNRPAILVALNQALSCPYFISVTKNPKIVFFGSKEATMYSLYGDIARFAAALTR